MTNETLFSLIAMAAIWCLYKVEALSTRVAVLEEDKRQLKRSVRVLEERPRA